MKAECHKSAQTCLLFFLALAWTEVSLGGDIIDISDRHGGARAMSAPELQEEKVVLREAQEFRGESVRMSDLRPEAVREAHKILNDLDSVKFDARKDFNILPAGQHLEAKFGPRYQGKMDGRFIIDVEQFESSVPSESASPEPTLK